jgi:hypothetical protein
MRRPMRKGKRASLNEKNAAARRCGREHEFALVLGNLPDLTDDVMDALFDAGCDDATFSLRYGLVFAEFCREADSYKGAVLSAIEDVRKADVGADVLRVNECDLVSAADIARRIDRSRELVSQYIKGDRGPGSFPPPECFLAEDKPLWAWCAVSHWLVENQLARPEVFEEAQFLWVLNDHLAIERQRRENPSLLREVKAALKPAAA